MTYSEIRARIEALCKIGGWTNVEPPPDYAFLGNEGSRIFFWEAQALTGDDTDTTVVGTGEYTLTTPPDWILVTDVLYGTDNFLVQSNESEIRRRDPLWTQADNATPKWWWMSEPGKVRIHPKPSTASVTLYFHGYVLDDVMDDGGDIPNCPAVFHEGICLLGAWHHGKLYARGDEVEIVDRYYAEGMKYVDRCQEYMAAQDAAVFTRRVKRGRPDYMVTGDYVGIQT